MASCTSARLDVTWLPTAALTFSLESDYLQERLYRYSRPQRVDGAALYAGYQLSTRFSVAARAEYLEDAGGLYSGIPQYLKEQTLTLDYRPADGFLVRGEFRRDHSSQHYFLTHCWHARKLTAHHRLRSGLVVRPEAGRLVTQSSAGDAQERRLHGGTQLPASG